MGFSIKYFLEQLEYRVSHSVSHMELLEFIEEQKQYAKECGIIE